MDLSVRMGGAVCVSEKGLGWVWVVSETFGLGCVGVTVSGCGCA